MLIEPIGFTKQEASSIILKTFKKGSGFVTLIDSLVIDSTVTRFNLIGDTLKIASTSQSVRMTSNYDYRITIPLTGSRFDITEINEPQLQGKKSNNKLMCVNSIQSCKINSIRTSVSFEKLYLKK